MAVVHVSAEQPYDVVVQPGALARLPDLLDGASRVAVVHPEVMAEQVRRIQELVGAAMQVVPVPVPTGEDAKTGAVLGSCWDAVAAAGLTRNDVVVGLGGGATTDLAGFVAATWLRGVRHVSVPTTVLAMVDAAVGGKTGINLGAGKNLVGAFWEPAGVLCDLELLNGLPPAEVSSGLAEVIKAGFTADPRILDLVEQDPRDAQDTTSVRFAELVRRAIEYKARVVGADLRESTSTSERIGREALNYGHTLGHAIEQHHHFTWRHGEAVSVGMVFMAEVSRRLLGLDAATVRRHRDVLASVGLPVDYRGATFAELRPVMSLDKKARGSRLRLIGLREVGRVALVEDPDDAVLADAFATLGG